MAAVERERWRLQRSWSRIEHIVDGVLAEHATTYWMRPVRRLEITSTEGGHGFVWTIDGEHVLEFRVAERGPASLVVHDFSLFEPLRRSLRTRHVRIRLATSSDRRLYIDR
jgi:hypothetical protein